MRYDSLLADPDHDTQGIMAITGLSSGSTRRHWRGPPRASHSALPPRRGLGGQSWVAELEQRLLEHPTYGPPIRRWRENRSVPRKAKWLASVLIASSIVLILLSPAPELLQWLLPPFLVCVTLWLWSRPDA